MNFYFHFMMKLDRIKKSIFVTNKAKYFNKKINYNATLTLYFTEMNNAIIIFLKQLKSNSMSTETGENKSENQVKTTVVEETKSSATIGDYHTAPKYMKDN